MLSYTHASLQAKKVHLPNISNNAATIMHSNKTLFKYFFVVVQIVFFLSF